MKNQGKKRKYEKPAIEQSEKINRAFLACRNAMAECSSTLQAWNSCPT
ncbi:MAG: hypothetical protein ACOC5F_04530 [Candidatus Aminicenantaceae bacterium]